ncbi:MAG TPA: SIMPL domain-containing protein [Dongiaceae bacterium]|nr:SIMPL domain-containing protein [Dongiaceae bacterium]
MKPSLLFRALFSIVLLLLALLPMIAPASAQQNSDLKFIAETLVVQAEGVYEADPDVAVLSFDINAQDKELKPTYDRAAQSLQRILALAEKNGVGRADISSGVLTIRPYYDGDRRKKARSYAVSGTVTLRVRDFSRLGVIMEGSVDDGITDFRSLTYELSDEESAKQKAVAEAMKRATGRASAALEAKGQKVGALRFANLDVHQFEGVSGVSAYAWERTTLSSEALDEGKNKKLVTPPPPPPLPQPQKITVHATIQCAFQIL